MSGSALPDLRSQDLAFFGTVAASLSHQINNVLTIVNELGGLVGDTVAAGTPGEAQSERLGRVAERIVVNVARGSEYIRILNRFSHSVDQPVADVDVGEQVLLTEAISRRFAELRGTRVEAEVPPVPVVIRTRPFRLLHLLFVSCQGALAVDGVGVVRLVLRAADGRVELRVEADARFTGTTDEHEARLELTTSLCRCLGARSVFVEEGNSFAFEIEIVPCAAGAEDGEST